MKGFSAIVCCYNSSSRIQETLIHLFGLNIPAEVQFELLLINNNSSDNTIEVAQETEFHHNNNKLPFRIIDELQPGLIHARKKGIDEAKFDWIVFCDDDNHLDSDYLGVAKSLIDQKEDVAIFGGWCKPKLPFYPGKWIEANYAALAIESLPRSAGYVDWVFGAGMIVKKDLYFELKRRFIEFFLTGRLGSKQTSGDDAELCQLARFIGYKIYYDPNMILHHCISEHRLTRGSFIKANYRNVFMVIYFFLLDSVINDRSLKIRELYLKFLKTRVNNVLYYMPRVFFGKNSFFSFMMFFQNIQSVAWALKNRSRFFNLHHAILNNLFTKHGRK